MQVREPIVIHDVKVKIAEANELFHKKNYLEAFLLYQSAYATLTSLNESQPHPQLQAYIVDCEISLLQCNLKSHATCWDTYAKQRVDYLQAKIYELISNPDQTQTINEMLGRQLKIIDVLLGESNDPREVAHSQYYFASHVFKNFASINDPNKLKNALIAIKLAEASYKRLGRKFDADSSHHLLNELEEMQKHCSLTQSPSTQIKPSTTHLLQCEFNLPAKLKRKYPEADQQQQCKKVQESPRARKKLKSVENDKQPKHIQAQQLPRALKRNKPSPAKTTVTATQKLPLSGKSLQSASTSPSSPMPRRSIQSSCVPKSLFQAVQPQQLALPVHLTAEASVFLKTIKELLNCMKSLREEDFGLILLEMANFHRDEIESCWLTSPHTEMIPAIFNLYNNAVVLHPDQFKRLNDFYNNYLALCQYMPSVDFDFEAYGDQPFKQHIALSQKMNEVGPRDFAFKAIINYVESLEKIYAEKSKPFLLKLLEHLQASGPLLRVFLSHKLHPQVQMQSLFEPSIARLQQNSEPCHTPFSL